MNVNSNEVSAAATDADADVHAAIAPPSAPQRPTARFMWSHPAHAIALGFGSGLSPIAPGTAGTLWAWVAFIVFDRWINDAGWGLLIGASALLGWWACTVTSRNLGTADSGHIVWDEVVAFWLILWLWTPAGLAAQVLAFALFRFFDAAKPGPVAWADQAFKGFGARGGFGVMADDLVAAFCTLLTLALLQRWWT